MRWIRRSWVVLMCLVLVACGGQDDATPATGTEPAASPTAAPADMTIGAIVWSEDADPATGEPAAPVETFTPGSPAIVASVEVANVPAGTTFTATWTLDDQPLDVGTMQVTAESDLAAGWVGFRFVLREGQQYPTGQLGVVITSSTGALREGSIEIAWP